MTVSAPAFVARLAAIAVRGARRAPMRLLDRVPVTVERGIEGDYKSLKHPRRAVTILAREDWEAALAGLTDLAGPVPLPWTARRANLLVEGVRLPQARGAIISIGAVELEVTGQTVPCARMDEAHPGLLKALGPHWRGGVTCRVVRGGVLSAGDRVAILHAPPERRTVLPG